MKELQKKLINQYKNRYKNKCDTSVCYFICKDITLYRGLHFSLYLAFHVHYKYGKKIPKIFFRSSIDNLFTNKKSLSLRLF